MSKTQTSITEFTPERDEITVTRTIKLPLATSKTKTAQVQAGVDAYQSVLSHMADRLPTYPKHEWEPHHSHMYHQAKRGLPDDDRDYKTTLAQQAQQQVAESFKSWRAKGEPGDSPRGDFGEGSYLSLRTDDVDIAATDGTYGLKASFISYSPVWFRIEAGAYQRAYLDRITDDDDDSSAGSAELHVHDGGGITAHLTVSWPVETYRADDVATTVGVDLNDDPLVAAAVVEGSDVAAVELESGAEYRHHRERVKRRRGEAMADGDLQAIKSARLTYQRYTDHITNVASRRVVELAREHAPCRIHLENLTHYRETAADPIHDWPYAEIQEKIAYKAREEGIPVQTVDPAHTSITCRKCGATNPAFRDGADFGCWDCGYEVHADVNAAINIATRDASAH